MSAWRRDADRSAVIKIAEELCYSEDIIQSLKDARSDSEISRIMRDARKRENDGEFEEDDKIYFVYVDKK